MITLAQDLIVPLERANVIIEEYPSLTTTEAQIEKLTQLNDIWDSVEPRLYPAILELKAYNEPDTLIEALSLKDLEEIYSGWLITIPEWRERFKGIQSEGVPDIATTPPPTVKKKRKKKE